MAAGKPSGAVTPLDIWRALERAGASSVQAAAIMGNMIHESSLNVESAARDSNGAMAYGLVSWNAASYPSAGSLVTGNPQKDLQDQVRFLAQTGGFRAAQGSTVQQAASSFAANYERCQGCQPGGSQNSQRITSAQTVAKWAASGSWPQSAGHASDTATLTSAQDQQQSATCLVGFSGSIPVIPFLWHQSVSACFLSKSQGRAIAGFFLLAAGSLIVLPGLSLIATAIAIDAVSAAQASVNRIPVVGSYSKGATASLSRRVSYQKKTTSRKPAEQPAEQA